MIIIDGDHFDIPVIGIVRRADFLDKFAERTNDGKLHRELIGVYFNYQILFGTTTDTDVYEELWTKLTEAVEFHEVTVPDESGVEYTFTAYFSNVGDKMRKKVGVKNYWGNLTVNFIAKEPAISA
jgi:hypothetical protein